MLNEKIKKMRMSHNLNQVELAKKLGVSKQCISNWENDNILPSVDMLVKIADLFGVSTDYLLGRDNAVTLNIEGLSEKEIAHIRMLVQDLKEKR